MFCIQTFKSESRASRRAWPGVSVGLGLGGELRVKTKMKTVTAARK